VDIPRLNTEVLIVLDEGLHDCGNQAGPFQTTMAYVLQVLTIITNLS